SSTDPPPHKGDSAAPPERDMNHRDHSTQSDEKDRTRHRRPRGTGAVFKKSDRWYGQWYVRGRLVKRSLGPVRPAGTRDGLTKAQAEARLRELISETDAAPPPIAERVTIRQAGERLIRQLVLQSRKPSTTENYSSYLKTHIEPYFGSKPVSEIDAEDVEG